MGTPAMLPAPKDVFRGMSNSNWCKRGVVTYRAYMLRAASETFPAETELSLGLTPEASVDALREHHGSAHLSCADVYALPHDLAIWPDAENREKAYMFGLPLYSTDDRLRDLAMTVAKDLAGISTHVQLPRSAAPD